MIFGKLPEEFVLLPTINIDWYHTHSGRHYYVQIAWLFWYISTLKYIDLDK